MATSYSEATFAMHDVRMRLAAQLDRLENAKIAITQAEADLVTMATQYSSIVTDVNAEVTADPSDAAWGTVKADMDKLLADRTDLKTRASAMKTAVDPL